MSHLQQPFDEAHDVEEADELASNLAVSPMPTRGDSGSMERLEFGMEDRGDSPPLFSDDDGLDGGEDGYGRGASAEPGRIDHFGADGRHEQDSMTSTDKEDEGSDGGRERGEGPSWEGAYNPADYADLEVSGEVQDLFQWITRYTPLVEELETRLDPFIPDYIPAVGDIDAFIKVPAPDRKPRGLGTDIVDEPCARQSDPTVLDLQLRSISKTTTTKALAVKAVPDAENNPKPVLQWIQSIADLHRNKPPQSVQYSEKMPDIDSLMQVWHPDFERALQTAELPTAELDLSLKEFVEVICGLLDIPVFDNHEKGHVESLHTLFSLFAEFKNSQHFKVQGEGLAAEGDGPSETLALDGDEGAP